MNIIKLKDVIMPSDFKMAEFFNTKLKGRYAYWIQMRYIFPLDSLDYKSYIQYEQLDPIDFVSDSVLPHIDLYSEDYCMIDFAHMFVDLNATECANDVCKYMNANKYATDSDIELSDLSVFRSWLADELLNMSISYSSEVKHMLEFYKNNMHNDVVKYLDMFSANKTTYQLNTQKSSCCCNTSSNVYDIATIDSCNPKTVYVDNIHKLMVNTFQDPSFWIDMNVEFIEVFKKYIDNIIKSNLRINTQNSTNHKFVLCDCQSNNDNSLNILNALSNALGYIIDNKGVGHMNYIHDALYNWAEYLYDYMYWNVK